uniref:wound-induced protein 1-like n=1 Tax=Erigeron canadensis TaxID=72917 RepID=UPI001CB9844A|nr:wound-induced protein 1-like [Erigeron canadensis]
MEAINKNIVCDFYKALAAHDSDMVPRLLSPNIDWWFHGPPAHKYNLMQLLTGSRVLDGEDSYNPHVVIGIGSVVIAEGCNIHENQKTYWVHAWTVENGIMTQVREYIDTFVTVNRIDESSNVCLSSPRSPKCKNMWESELVDNDCVPRLLLVI